MSNCKVGDLAVIVSSEHQKYIGFFVEIVEPYDGLWLAAYGPAWWVTHRGERHHCLDADLRPIRDNDADDETLTWAPLSRVYARESEAA